jgi:hypothetical protein
MVTVNGTTNSPSAVACYVSIPPGSYDIQDGGMAATQALVINVQISVDNTNFLTVATWTPPTTNATSWKFNPSYATQPIYLRSQIVTTGAIPVGVLFNNPNL